MDTRKAPKMVVVDCVVSCFSCCCCCFWLFLSLLLLLLLLTTVILFFLSDAVSNGDIDVLCWCWQPYYDVLVDVLVAATAAVTIVVAYYSGREAPSLKMRTLLFCRRWCRTFEITQYALDADWLAPLIITLFARADHVWAKCSGQMT